MLLYKTQHKPNLDALPMNIVNHAIRHATLRMVFSRRLYSEESARLSTAGNRFRNDETGLPKYVLNQQYAYDICEFGPVEVRILKWTAFYSVLMCVYVQI